MDRKTSLTFFSVLALSLCLVACSKPEQSARTIDKDPILLATGHDSAEPPNPELQKAALVNVELGIGYLNQGQTARAKSKLTHAIKLAPNSQEVHTAMAYFLERVGDIKESEKEHRKALRLGNSKAAVNNNYGAFLCRQNRLKEADDAFQKALADKQYERTADVYENAGMCALKGSNVAAAEQYFTTALLRDPKRINTMLELAALNMQQGRLQEAKGFLNQYKRISDPSPRSLWLGIQLSQRLNDSDGIASQSLLLKNLFENSPEYQMYLRSTVGNDGSNPVGGNAS